MRKHPVTVALIAAGVLVGAHAGFAAITEAPKAETATGMQTEMQAIAESQTAVQAPAPVAEVQAPAEAQPSADATQPVTPPVVSVEGPAVMKAPVATAAAPSDEYTIRIPFTNRVVKVRNPTFPSAGLESPDPLPATLAYFEQRDRNVQLAGARGQIFPSAGLETSEPLPATIAYFEQIEARRIAATRAPVPAPVVTVPAPAPVVTAPAEAPATVAAPVVREQPVTQAPRT